MPIIAKSELAARTTAKRAAAAPAVYRPEIAPRARKRAPPTQSAAEQLAPATDQKPKRRRGHARKNEDGKWMPTSPEGFACPPKDKRFKKGCKPGPGRRKGSKSQDTLMRKEYSRKRKVRIEGKDRTMTARELLVATEFNLALKGDKQARRYILSEAQRLYREDHEARAQGGAGAMPTMSETDAGILQWYREDILHDLQNPEDDPDTAPPVDGDDPDEVNRN